MTPPESGHPPDDDPDEPPDHHTDDASDESNEPIDGTNEPVDENDEPVDENDEPVNENGGPIGEDGEPVSEDREPVGEGDESASETDEPVAPSESGRPAGGWADDGGEGRSLLSSLLGALDSLDRISNAGVRDRNRGVEYDVSIDTGIGGPRSRSDRRGLPGGPIEEGEGLGGREPSRERRTRRRPPTSSGPTAVQERDDELVVTADLAGVEPNAVTVGLDEDRLVIGVEGTALERVAVPWQDPAIDARLNNGVLSVVVTPGGEAGE